MLAKDFIISFLSGLTNFGNNRYVKKFSRAPLFMEESQNKLETEAEKSAYLLVEECASLFTTISEKKYPILKKLDEIIVLIFKDLDGLQISAKVKNGLIKVSVGRDEKIRPTLIIPLFQANILNLKKMMSDQEVDKTELYRIARVLFPAFIRGLYDAEYLYTPGDKRYLKLDNIFHVELLNPEKIIVDGFPDNAKVTVTNVNGNWLVFNGFQGQPRMRVSCDLEQSLEYYRILMIEFKKAKSAADLEKVFKDYMNLRQKTTTDLYKR